MYPVEWVIVRRNEVLSDLKQSGKLVYETTSPRRVGRVGSLQYLAIQSDTEIGGSIGAKPKTDCQHGCICSPRAERTRDQVNDNPGFSHRSLNPPNIGGHPQGLHISPSQPMIPPILTNSILICI